MVHRGRGKYNFLIGEFRHSLDDKYRLLIPAKFRPFLEDGFILMPGFSECIYIIPLQNFFPLYQRLASLPMESEEARRILQFFGRGQERRLDRQGRVVIPEELRRHAHIEREVIVAGRFSYIEVWSAVVWEFYSKKQVSPELVQESLEKFSLRWPFGAGLGSNIGVREDEGGEALPPPRPGRRRGEPPEAGEGRDLR